MTDDDLTRSDVEALAETRAELGRSYEADLLAGFADRVEAAIDDRVRHQVARRDQERALARRGTNQQFTLAILSLIACIPIGIPLALNGHVAALAIILAGIVAVNAAFAAVVNGPRRP